MSGGLLLPNASRVSITVGGPGADVPQYDSLAIQLALDMAAARGGGEVKLGSGVFNVLGPIRLRDNVSLVGEGDQTVLRKSDGFRTTFIQDADYGELKAVVSDSSGFCKGMGIQLYDSISSGGWDVSTAIVTAVDGNVVHFDAYLVRDYLADSGGVISNACSLIEGVEVRNARVENLALEGNRDTNEFINGCRGGAIYFHKSSHCTVDGVRVDNFNGDGISWQITEHITVHNCVVAGCTNFGLHPGTGSHWSVVEGCECHHNGSNGIYVCWRVQRGVFRSNQFHHNGANGVSIGHKDTDNRFERNRIYQNHECGIYVRQEKESNGAHRNAFVENVIEDNGNAERGFGVMVHGVTGGITFESNEIRDTGTGLQRVGVFIHPDVTDIGWVKNELSGHTVANVVSEEPSFRDDVYQA